MVIYVATTNKGKLNDFSAAAAELFGEPLILEPLPGLREIPAPVEDELTFAGNARLKAIAYSLHAPGALVVADDSGLEVDALGGDPGVRSARYAEDHDFQPSDLPTDERNNRCLLEAMKGIAASDRAGRYRCVLSAARDGVLVAEGDGSVEGTLLATPRGDLGFGYDPLFYLPELNRTMAEIDATTKLKFSHRGRAFRALIESLQHIGPNRSQIQTEGNRTI